MAPLKPRQSLNRERFGGHFAQLRAQLYNDAASTRGGSSNTIRTISWNPLGSLVATGSTDKTVRVWNPEKPNVRFSTELKGHLAPIEKVAFNPVKDAELCSISNDGTVKFWDVRTKNCTNEVTGLGAAFTLAWAPDGESLVVGNKTDCIFVLSPTESTPRASFQQDVQTNQISFCWSGTRVFVTTGEGRVRILSYPDFQPVLLYPYDRSAIDGPGATNEYMLKGHTSSCLSVELSPNARYLATGGTDSVICMWDTTDWICQRTFPDMVGAVKSLSFSWDGFYIVGGSDDGNAIEVYHCESGENVHTFKTATACPVVAWAPTRYFLAYSDAGQLRIVGVDPDRK